MMNLIAAEFLKLSRQRALLFWGFFAIPVLMTALAFVLESAAPTANGLRLGTGIHPLRSAMRAVTIAGNPIAQLCFAIGASAIFSVEYRHSAWRHVVPRAGRTALLFAKALTYLVFAGVSLLTIASGDLLASLFAHVTLGVPSSDVAPATIGGLTLAFSVSFAEMLTLGGIVALMAVLTRSTLGAILPPFFFSFGVATAEALITPTGDELARIPLPTCAADAIRSWIWSEPENLGATSSSALLAAAVLLTWILVPPILAAIIFRRQDLSAE